MGELKPIEEVRLACGQRFIDVKLEIDVGNTRLKWRVLDENGLRVSAGHDSHDGVFLDSLQQQFKILASVCIACVAQASIKQNLCQRVFSLWGVEARLARTQKKHAGLQVAYDDPSRLGVDRWLAMLAAWHDAKQGVCVIDCGSAITVDLVDGKGLHLGGYIVPGLAMQKNSLLSSTSQIRMDEQVAGCKRAWGSSTEEAVNLGVLRMVTSFINAIVDEVVEDVNAYVFYITGGDASALLSRLHYNEQFCHRPELVLDGLAIALP